MSAMEKWVLVAMADYADDKHQVALTTTALSKRTNLHRSNVRKHIQRLNAAGAICEMGLIGPGGRKTILYKLNVTGSRGE